MAELKMKIDTGDVARDIRASLTESSCASVMALGIVFPTILRLMQLDPVSRMMIAEAMGEQAVEEDRQRNAHEDAGYHMPEKSWDEIMLEVIENLADTPAGRCDVQTPENARAV